MSVPLESPIINDEQKRDSDELSLDYDEKQAPTGTATDDKLIITPTKSTNYIETPKPNTIANPPALIRFNSTYSDQDRELEAYLLSKFQAQISKLAFFPYDIVVRFVTGYRHCGGESNDYVLRQTETEKLFANYLAFHETSGYDSITTVTSSNSITDSKQPQISAKDIVPGCYFYGHDKHGHPIFIQRYCELYDSVGLFKQASNKAEVDYDKADRFLSYSLKRLHLLQVRNSKMYLNINVESEKQTLGIFQGVVVLDLRGFSVTKFFYERKFFEYLTKRMQALAPESLHRVLIINAPWMFVKVWKIFKKFLHPVTVEKTTILGGEYLEEMNKEIASAMIPKELGGTAEWKMRVGDICEGFYESLQVGDGADCESLRL